MKTKQQIFLGTFSILDILSHCSHTTSKGGSLCVLKNMNVVPLASLIQFSEKKGEEKEGRKLGKQNRWERRREEERREKRILGN